MMKKIIALLLLMVLALTSCSGKEKNDTETKATEPKAVAAAEADKGSYDIDLSAFSTIAAYSEISNMIKSPTKYMGKSIKVKGVFATAGSEESGKVYFACVIKDETACCNQAIEFVLADKRKYPDEYPKVGSEITVAGNFATYYEGEKMYIELRDAVLL